jgi:uncharacterized membrane protein YeaQ/YmgE (transglycosylase-associated protein family)
LCEVGVSVVVGWLAGCFTSSRDQRGILNKRGYYNEEEASYGV